MTAEDKAKNAGKVALVLEGGSFRGQFTAGVLDVLMEAGVEIPAVYGVSAGALNGVNYKSHQIGRANRINLAFCNDNRFMGAASFASTGSIVGYDFIFNDVQDRLDPFDNETFDASPIEMYAVATDMLFGTATYLPVKSAVLDLDAVAHPADARRLDAVEQQTRAVVRQLHLAVLADLGSAAGAAELMDHQLLAVADAENGQTQLENGVVERGGVRLKYRRGAAGEDDGGGAEGADVVHRHGVGLDLAVDVLLPHPPGDQLIVLSAKVQNQDFFLHTVALLPCPPVKY